MSWFKRTSSVREDGRLAVNGRDSPSRDGGRDRADTDPDTCFEVFKNHWQQACNVINASGKKNGSTNDDIETVVHNFEQMVTLLVGEEGIDGMPGPIAHFLLEKDVLENFCNWCSSQHQHQDKLCMEQLCMYELLISQSRQLLLIHRPVIRPLLRLLLACAETQLPNSASEELEFRLVLVLHQICTCISQETVILESFFSTEADHGPAKFLIFSLLIPYIHREGPVGQRARDALLLLMTLSARHPHIGRYIAENSDFCPVLATGLSGLYSSLPRKITPPSDDWYALTEEDCQRIPDLQMFLNSLEFCNAVVQVAHPLVRDQLIKYIYTGFLLPVLGPALHQDISGLPIPLLDTAMFMNSRDEVMTATAYLDLFLRRISEPHLIRAFLRFVLTERHDEMLILESLITRINSNTKLSLISLSLFHTLVDLNCEEVMFHLVFKYLIPCTHVMVSQRRAVRDLDLYGKSAEKFLSLRPVCCMTYPPVTAPPIPNTNTSPNTQGTLSMAPMPARTQQASSRREMGRSASISTPAELAKVPTKRRSGIFRSRKEKKKLETLPEDEQKSASDSASTASSESATSVPDDASALSESSYVDYLHESRSKLEQCAKACRRWSAPYDGENPPPDSDLDPVPVTASASVSDSNSKATEVNDAAENANSSSQDGERRNRSSSVKLLSHGNVSDVGCVHMPDSDALTRQANRNANAEHEQSSSALRTSGSSCSDPVCNTVHHSACTVPKLDQQSLSKLYSSLDTLDSFLACLNELDIEVSVSSDNKLVSVDDSLSSLEALLSSLSTRTQSSTGRKFRGSSSSSGHLSDNSTPDREESGKGESSGGQAVPLVQSAAETSVTVADTSVTVTETSATASDPIVTSMQSTVSKSPAAPPKSLGLAPAKDFSLGGPFLSAVFGRLEGMVQNSLYANLLLTGLVARLAAYPQPLLRSFLLNVNLVFQPTVKSLVQVLSSVRQKVDGYSVTTRNFGTLLIKARRNLKLREDYLMNCMMGGPSHHMPNIDYNPGQTVKPRAATVSEGSAEKKKLSFGDLLFRRSPRQRQGQAGGAARKGQQLQRVEVAGSVGYRFINSFQQDVQENPEESLKTWNAVYCALILEEFLKELAAMSLEHSVLNVDEGYVSS